MSNPLLQYIEQNRQDAVVFKATTLHKMAGDDSFVLDLNFQAVGRMLAKIPSEFLQEHYVKTISKIFGVKANQLQSIVKKDAEIKKKEESIQFVKEGKKALESWINKDYFYTYNFDQRRDYVNKENTGIYFAKSDNGAVQLTNFTIKPLFHVFSSDDTNRRLTEIDNGYVREVIELPSRAWGSTDMFESTLLDKGVFFTNDGFSKSNLNRLKSVFLPQYHRCYELKKLGWQREGFFAFSNLIYHKGNLVRFDEYGTAEVDGTKYLSMGASKVLAGLRDSDNDYKNDNFLKYTDAGISFGEWTKYMMGAYSDKGMMGTCYVIMAVFKDIIFKRNNNCPIPYLFGAAQSGKSKFGESTTAPFTGDMPALNLNQTTEFALWEALESFYNVLRIFNEMDENSIPEEYTRAFKGAFDGEGRKKGSGRKGKTITQEINCLAMLIGQYLSTSDDGALLQRTLPEKFVENNNRSKEQLKAFNDLKKLEKKGLSSILCELFDQREYVDKNYSARFYELLDRMKAELQKDDLIPKNRILENYVNALTVTSLILDKLELAFNLDEFFEYCKDRIKSLSSVISETNALAGFWKTVELLIDQDIIEQGYDFKVEMKPDVILAAKERNKTYTKTFTEPKKLLYIRFSTIHSLYLKEFKQQTGKQGMSAGTVQSYLQDLDSFLGSSPSSAFKNKKGKSTITSSYVFDYDLLGANLERGKDEDERTEVSFKAVLQADAKVIDVLGALKVTFTAVQDESYYNLNTKIEKITYTHCFSKDTESASVLKKDAKVKLTGMLDQSFFNDRVRRRLEVQKFEIIESIDEKSDMSF